MSTASQKATKVENARSRISEIEKKKILLARLKAKRRATQISTGAENIERHDLNRSAQQRSQLKPQVKSSTPTASSPAQDRSRDQAAVRSKAKPGQQAANNPLQGRPGGAAELQQLLHENFESPEARLKPTEKRVSKKVSANAEAVSARGKVIPDERPKDPATSKQSVRFSATLLALAKAQRTKQVIKTLVGILLIIAAGWAPAARLFQVSSVEAIINARVVTVRTPIEGVVQFQREISDLYDVLGNGALIAKVENQRIDTSQANDLTKQIELELIEFDRVKAEKKSLLFRRARLVDRVEQYRTIRLKELQTRIDEAIANQAEFEAKLASTDARRERSAKLFEKELVAVGSHYEIQNEVAILNAGLERVKAQRRRVELEYDTLAEGGFFGDSFNDQIRPATEIDTTDDAIAEVNARLAALSDRIESLEQSLEREKGNLNRQQHAEIILPVTGQIWEPLVANGEQVSRGQPLLRMLDCKTVLVTTAVSEEVYNRLTVGEKATFILRGSNREFAARVTQLSGVSSASANLAILPSALEKEPYRATVKVPELDAGGQCLLGKTGRVIFDVKT